MRRKVLRDRGANWTACYAFLVLCVALVFGGCGKGSDAPADRLVNIGTHVLHLYCQGTGNPTVVIDTGSGETYESWLPLIGALAQETRVCAYDRAGYGQSEPGPLPRDADREANELRLLLQTGDVAAPYVLVGHSLGALNAQEFASRSPDLLDGVVLLDPTPLAWLTGDAFPELLAMLTQQADTFRSQAEAMRSSPDAKDRATIAFLTMLASEMTELPQATARQLAVIRSFGDLPVTVVGATKPDPRFGASAEAFRLFWNEQSEQLAQKSTRGVFVRAEGSSHHIHLDAPELVRNTVLGMVLQARKRSCGAPLRILVWGGHMATGIHVSPGKGEESFDRISWMGPAISIGMIVASVVLFNVFPQKVGYYGTL
jgi:pimeloyl-ACP methyl ester carboxylesterase